MQRRRPGRDGSRGCLIIVIDSHVPSLAVAESTQSDRRNVASMLFDLNFLDAIDAMLPQTQCTRCGYPDCASYAQAVAEGEAAAWLHEPRGAPGERESDAGRHEGALSGQNDKRPVFRHGGAQIHAG